MLHNLRFLYLQNAVYFKMLTCLVPVLFAFYLQGVLKFKCKIPAPKGYSSLQSALHVRITIQSEIRNYHGVAGEYRGIRGCDTCRPVNSYRRFGGVK